MEHKLRQKRDRVASIREECDAARGALKARESDNDEASRVGKKEQADSEEEQGGSGDFEGGHSG